MTFTNAITTRSAVFAIDNSDEAWTLADGPEIDSDTLTLEHVSKADLHASDFVF